MREAFWTELSSILSAWSILSIENTFFQILFRYLEYFFYHKIQNTFASMQLYDYSNPKRLRDVNSVCCFEYRGIVNGLLMQNEPENITHSHFSVRTRMKHLLPDKSYFLPFSILFWGPVLPHCLIFIRYERKYADRHFIQLPLTRTSAWTIFWWHVFVNVPLWHYGCFLHIHR